jgi:hypothetical protein
MSDPNADLVYGFILRDGAWRVEEIEENGYDLMVDWLPRDEEGYQDTGEFEDIATHRLMVEIARLDPADLEHDAPEGARERIKAAEARLKGLEVITFADTGGDPSYALIKHRENTDWDQPRRVQQVELVERCEAEGWDDDLAAAVKVLGLTPIDGPAWWLLATQHS